MANKTKLPTSFTEGILPDYIYEISEKDIRSSILINGDKSSDLTWDKEHRKKLFDGFMVLANELKSCGFDHIFLDGSFVEEKGHPNDIDAYFDLGLRLGIEGSVKVHQRLTQLKQQSKMQIWDWTNRVLLPGFKKPQLKMWVLHKVEIFPHYGLPSGIKDDNGNDLQFPAAFRQSRSSTMSKGIVKLKF
jgi:hypothetical protein